MKAEKMTKGALIGLALLIALAPAARLEDPLLPRTDHSGDRPCRVNFTRSGACRLTSSNR